MNAAVLRVARACSDLDQARRFYCDGLGLQVLVEFADHEGFDGLVVGLPGVPWHLELVVEHGAFVSAPSPEDLIVLYESDPAAYEERRRRLLDAGFEAVRSNNPYWDRCGVTFEGPDGYRTVIAHRAWTL
jgi:catechol 2,3-dioxygenase-like lactoylglutathione lyase family enzyme